MSNAAVLDLESKVLNALDSCICKMSDCLNRDFDPADKRSMNLFRQFCSALRSRVQWMKQFFASDLLSAAKAAMQTAAKAREALAAVDIDKNKTAEKKESPILRGLIEETHNFGPAKKQPASKKEKINGLLRKF